MNILLVAAENDGIHGGKTGGIGDVIRDIAPGLADMGCRVTTVIPSYGFLHRCNPSKSLGTVMFPFGGAEHPAGIYEVEPKQPRRNVTHLVMDLPFQRPSDGGSAHAIYTHDPPERPYATDAGRFAVFCSAVGSAVVQVFFKNPDCIHLHDWHTAFLLMLRKFHAGFTPLKNIRTVYTIHNLALQGIRPFRGDRSSLEAWYPALPYIWADVSDPRWPDCVNPMAAGIRLADAVHTVSPSYAEEIRTSSRNPESFSGGEGLERDLEAANKSGRLFGILNGCDYPVKRRAPILSFPDFVKRLNAQVLRWCGGSQTVAAAHFLAYARLAELSGRSGRPPVILTGVGRAVEQKMRLMREAGASGKSGIQGILEALGRQGVCIFLGAGDREYEQFLTGTSARFENFIFLNGYSDDCADALYANGDLFLMPSSFEPCGIGQMLAMRDGQPCLVHGVGGLKDTVEHGVTGFVFTGDTVPDQVDRLIQTAREAMAVKRDQPELWQTLRQNASSTRFFWKDSLRAYIDMLYKGAHPP